MFKRNPPYRSEGTGRDSAVVLDAKGTVVLSVKETRRDWMAEEYNPALQTAGSYASDLNRDPFAWVLGNEIIPFPSYATAAAWIAKGRSGTWRPAPSRNTTLALDIDTDGTPCVSVRLYNTDVVRIRKDGTYALRSGRWWTSTTLARMSEYSPSRPFADRGGERFVSWDSDILMAPPADDGWKDYRRMRVLFREGIRVDVRGRVVGRKDRARMEIEVPRRPGSPRRSRWIPYRHYLALKENAV